MGTQALSRASLVVVNIPCRKRKWSQSSDWKHPEYRSEYIFFLFFLFFFPLKWIEKVWHLSLKFHIVRPSLKIAAAAAAAKSLQSCLTLCNPIDGSPQGSPVPGILQARTLERVAISFYNAWKWKLKVKLLSRVGLLATPWTAAYQAPPSMEFSRQKYWSGVPLPSPFEKLWNSSNKNYLFHNTIWF